MWIHPGCIWCGHRERARCRTRLCLEKEALDHRTTQQRNNKRESDAPGESDGRNEKRNSLQAGDGYTLQLFIGLLIHHFAPPSLFEADDRGRVARRRLAASRAGGEGRLACAAGCVQTRRRPSHACVGESVHRFAPCVLQFLIRMLLSGHLPVALWRIAKRCSFRGAARISSLQLCGVV